MSSQSSCSFALVQDWLRNKAGPHCRFVLWIFPHRLCLIAYWPVHYHFAVMFEILSGYAMSERSSRGCFLRLLTFERGLIYAEKYSLGFGGRTNVW